MSAGEQGRGAARRATISDVAAAAGVSVGTVSRVLNGHAEVAAERRAAVEHAITRLGYRRNVAAARLRRGEGTALGLLVEDVADPFYSQIHRAVEDAALERGWTLLVASGAGEPRRARTQLAALAAHGVDAMLATLPVGLGAAEAASLIGAGTPLVLIDRPARGEADSVVTDNREGAAAGVAELLRRGHRRIACLVDRGELHTAREREAGYREAMDAAGAPVEREWVVRNAADPAVDLAGELGRLLGAEAPVTALFTGNNRITARTLAALHTTGRGSEAARPELLGFDDLELAEHLVPPLSVVAQDAAGLARAAVELAEWRLGGATAAPAWREIPARLLRR